MASRRDFLRSALRNASLLATAPAVPGFLAATARAAEPAADGRVLVVIQLDGGNDGLNTVVPFRDDGYARNRKALRLDAGTLIKVTDSAGLHPSLAGAADLLQRGELAIVQGVGYPNPSRSHFRSMAVWHSARLDPDEHGGPGWLGRVFDDRLAAGDGVGSYFVGGGMAPDALLGRRSAPGVLERPGDLVLTDAMGARAAAMSTDGRDDLLAFVRRTAVDAYATAGRVAEMPGARGQADPGSGEGLAGRLSFIARLMRSGVRARVFYTGQGGYDTHAAQLNTHAALLGELSRALKGFQGELEASGLADRVAVLAFSEFGRRLAENGSGGTDHGTAGPVILAGKHVRPGLTGDAPSLTDLEDGDPRMTVDFRRVYAAVLRDWLGIPPAIALDGRFEPLPLFQAT
ncbi:hypothetical protein OJF2_71790 [Aquisphaera giovannonii]|uniref:DUF1501 domain-containing protein n=1 Tax=Aquisphaera giovannonii TaxID=406548 RepID=A0A5B9WEU7_9BACT|nr:DUF1501 domain-containing protein [Aquisphaera giovannonii]QEH38575.1 hypothetical protein OJF2_71790 [Aquisphaera giovannonii]